MNDHPSVGKVIQTALLKQDMADSPMQEPAPSQFVPEAQNKNIDNFNGLLKPFVIKTWQEDEEEKQEEVFSINTSYSRVERHPIREVCKEMDWNESRSDSKGSLFWFIDACNSAQRKMMRASSAIFNRYPKISTICLKREFHILMKKFQLFFKKDYDFIPDTYILPEDIKAYKRYLDTTENAILLAKPSKGRGGQGIFFVKRYADLDQESMKDYEYVAQHYIPNPFLIDNKKFDFRMYLMIKGVEDMEAYIAFEGLCRFCTEDYSDPLPKNDCNDEEEETYMNLGEGEDNLMGHLTNYCLNKDSAKYVNNNNFKESDDGTKRLLSSVFKTLEAKGVDIEKFKADTIDICTKLTYAFRPHVVNTYHFEIGKEGAANQNCFHILGLDLMLDADHKLWVLEINAFPSFNYFFDRIEIDPKTKRRQRVKQISELDRYLKMLLIREAVLINKGEPEKCSGVFQKVFPPEPEVAEEYEKYSIYDKIRKIFEHLCGNNSVDFLSLDQFTSLADFGGLKYEALTKGDYTTIFKEYAKSANKSLLSLNQFNKAFDCIAKSMMPTGYSKYKRLCSLLEKIGV